MSLYFGGLFLFRAFNSNFNLLCRLAKIAQSLSDDLDRHFLQQELLDTFGIVYPQYWKQLGAEDNFGHHLAMLKKFYPHPRQLNARLPSQERGPSYIAPKMLCGSNLDNQQGLLKVTMRANYEATCASVVHMNPIIQLSCGLFQSRHLKKLISEYFKLVEIGCYLIWCWGR